VILRFDRTADTLMHLTCAAAVAACDAVEDVLAIRTGIKWTNDLVVGKRKIAGILTELGIGSNGKLDYAVIGIGINCRQSLSDFPEEIRSIAGSLHSVSGLEIDRAKVAAAMTDALYRMAQTLRTGKAAIMNRYRADCVTLGQWVSVVKSDGSVRHGTALDIDSDGALLVRFDDGTLESVNSGEVSVRGLYGYV
jgi:BirA family biotin operon repressor/biotin-[acetyl-CoA-carboxylase] ligase